MTHADDRLKALFAQDLPPARDPAFQAAVMERVARRQLAGDLALLGGVAVAGAAALWGLWPTLQPALVATSQGLAPVAAALALGLGALLILGARPAQAFGLES